jgi:hypothetical protein
MTFSTTYAIPFKSRGRLFVEIPEHIKRDSEIVAGEPLQLQLIGQDIVYRKTVNGHGRRNDRMDSLAASQTKDSAAGALFSLVENQTPYRPDNNGGS